jgi:quercetin dioxygenase-like cupin family protein
VRNSPAIAIAAVLAIAACSKNSTAGSALNPQEASAQTTSASNASSPQQSVVWSSAPAVLPPGAEIAVLHGDPSKAEEFTMRLRFPNGYKIAPHTHPTTENITVLTGTFLIGMGTQFVDSDLQAFGRDGFVIAPAEHPHYAKARGQTVVQIHGMGPFALTYVNTADTPASR